MKTKLLIAALCLGSMASKAQTTLYSNDFSAATGLSIIDADGDMNNWGLYTGDATSAAWGLTGNFAGSASYDNTTGPLTPDNYLFTTDAIAIPESFGTTTLSLVVGAIDLDFPAEHIAVYLIPEANNTPALITAYTAANTAPIELTLTAAYAQTATVVSADVSSFAGQSVRIAVRHFNVTDQYIVYIDDLMLTQSTLATQDFASSQFSVFPNPATSVINVSAKNNAPVTSISLTDLNGRTVKQNSFDNLSNVQVNIADLSAGIYMMNITSPEGTATKKIIKN